MESIFFEKKGTKLILRYTPDNGVDWLFEKIAPMPCAFPPRRRSS